jgi:hypothetical protein
MGGAPSAVPLAGRRPAPGRPLVSVVMSVRDEERFVAQAVESILAQTLPDLELVVVDDASTDRTPEILSTQARRDARLRVCRLPGRSGLAAALNLGCGQARGTLIARMDGDDVALPHRLASQVAFLRAHPDVALVGGGAIVIDAAGRPLDTRCPPAGDAQIRASLDRRNCLIHSTVTLRRDALRALGGYRAAFLHAEDYDLWLRFAERHRLANLPEPVLRYRVHGTQVSQHALEQQVVSTLAAQVAARRRRAGEAERVGPAPITRAILVGLGVPAAAIRGVMETTCIHRAAELAALGQTDLAVATLAVAPGFAGAPAARRHAAARLHAELARRLWRRRQLGRSLAAAGRAVRLRPALLARAAWRVVRVALGRAPPAEAARPALEAATGGRARRAVRRFLSSRRRAGPARPG